MRRPGIAVGPVLLVIVLVAAGPAAAAPPGMVLDYVGRYDEGKGAR